MPYSRMGSAARVSSSASAPSAQARAAPAPRPRRGWLASKRPPSLQVHLPALHSDGHANTATVNKQEPHKMPHRRVSAPEMQWKVNSQCSFQQPLPPVNNPLLSKKEKENLITALQLAKKARERNAFSLFIFTHISGCTGSPPWCAGFARWWRLWLWSTSSRRTGVSSCARGSRAQAQESWRTGQLPLGTWGLPDQGSNRRPAISSSVLPFSSCPQSLPASGSFPMSQLFASGGQSIGVSASASVLPMNTQD